MVVDLLPPYVQAALAHPVAERKTWTYGIASNYIAVFLWVAYYDQLAGPTLLVGGLMPAVLGAAAGGLLAYVLLFLAPALMGLWSRQPFEIVATATFGVRGARWLANGLMGLAQIAVCAIAVSYAADFILRGLVTVRLLDGSRLQALTAGGVTLPSALFLITAFVWCMATCLVGAAFARWVGAIMLVFPIVPAVLLGGAMLWALVGMGQAPGPLARPVVASEGRVDAFLMMIQLVFAFFAVAGAAAVDWGAASREPRDVGVGGLVGVAMAAPIIAALVLVTIAGAQARAAGPPAAAEVPSRLKLPALPRTNPGPAGVLVREPRIATFGAVLEHGIGGPIGGAMLMTFGLGSLAPAVFAALVFGRRFQELWPAWRRVFWTLLGAAIAFVMIALGIASHLDRIFSLLGAAFAPLLGAVAAEFLRTGNAWSGPRRGINPAGLVAWLLGFAVGVIPLIGLAAGQATLARVQPAAVLAFATGFIVNLLMARFGFEPATVAMEVPQSTA